MIVFLVRHGIAQDPSDLPIGTPDSARALTSEGQERTGRVAKGFRQRWKGPAPAVIYHSPFVRARETAAFFHAEFPGAVLELAPHLRPNDEVERVPTLLEAARREGREAVMLVGHEPFMGALTSYLLTGNTAAPVEFKKAAIAGFDWYGRSPATLLFLAPPRFFA